MADGYDVACDHRHDIAEVGEGEAKPYEGSIYFPVTVAAMLLLVFMLLGTAAAIYLGI